VLVTHQVNVRYLTGFTGSAGVLLLPASGGEAVLMTDGRYEAQAAREAPDVRCELTRRPWKTLARVLAAGGSESIVLGFEAHHMAVAEHSRLRDALEQEGPAVRLEPLSRPVERLRRTKDGDEIARLRAACQVADAALERLLREGLQPGVTEVDVARRIDDGMRRGGAEDRAFPTIVAFGESAAEPHHRPTARALIGGDLVKIDFGAVVDGYHSDMTRTMVVGPPAAWQRDLHSLVLEAQERAIAAVRGAIRVSDVDAVARTVIERGGYGERYPHGLGHGVGLEVHEEPILGPGSTATLEDRYVVTVEPGVYLPGRGGVRIEDVVVVGPDGCEVLTGAPRDLISL
jgi:Xaa-Pro aminopeptidase